MPSLEFHPASPEERLAAYRNVHDVWGGGLPIEQHVERRLASVRHNLADWYVGCLDGRVIASLGTYRLQFHYRGELVPGFSIGSVHTHADFRGRGYAAELIDFVERDRREKGERIAMLYSDIACRYYARLGYVECPSWLGLRQAVALDEPSKWRLDPCDPYDSLPELLRMYAAYHGAQPIAVAHGPQYSRHLLKRCPDDTFAFLVDGEGRRCGYVRLAPYVRIVEFALVAENGADEAALQDALLRLVLDHAARQGAERVGGWLPDWPATRALFDMQPRPQEITMLKALDDGIVLDQELIASAHVFCEIDHV